MTDKQARLAAIPQVDQVLKQPVIQNHLKYYAHPFVVALIQEVTTGLRQQILEAPALSNSGKKNLLSEVAMRVDKRLRQSQEPSLRRVINATGIILHTGLGRAPLPKEAQANLVEIADGYCNLEFDLETGKRGQRAEHVEQLLCQLTGAEAACVVNNNAAAVLLTLNTLAFEKETIVSRGQLVEIGGSFRIPEVMAKSGTRMVDVGATNKTHLRDYEIGISASTGLICIVHTSNYRVQGFVNEVALAEIVSLAHRKKLPVMQDLGGGILLDLAELGLPHEPVVRDSIKAGVDVVTFSGDKVLGGPQTGIIVGKKDYIAALQRNPLMRALRCDKLTFAALEPVLKHYLQSGQLQASSEVFSMLMQPVAQLERRAQSLKTRLEAAAPGHLKISIVDSEAQVGSGALPLETLPSKAITLMSSVFSPERLARELRLATPPIVGYIRDNHLRWDLRTVRDDEDTMLVTSLATLFKSPRFAE